MLTSKPPTTDLLIAGAGPAGLLLAGAAAERGLKVTVADPSPTGPFEATFALFEDQLPEHLRGAVRCRYPYVTVHTDGGPRTLAEPYLRLDSERLASALRGAEGVEVISAAVRGVSLEGEGFHVALTEGGSLHARRVVDATGHRPALLPRAPAPHQQIALGAVLRGPLPHLDPILMDLRGDDDGPPTFLYALPLSSDAVFVEETALITTARPSWTALEARLRARLRAMGWEGELEVVERCRIPMDPALPDLRGPVLSFGAAAGLVHPSTGYQLAASLALAGPLASQLARSLSQRPRQAARGYNAVLWPAERRRVRSLQRFGAHFLATLPRRDQAAFFDAFFQLPPSLVRAWLAHDGSMRQVTAAMRGVFGLLPLPLRARLAGRGLLRPAPLLRPLLGL
ncbi:MAG: lycopene cyclase family protein [Deltaproteobacteria bacterium]|nr:lycopene cyclase family protein [Deltaproteobacteria bacterium]